MKKVYKLLVPALIILAVIIVTFASIYADSIDCDENTLIISQCTANMRGLETGISVYAGYKGVPMLLSDKRIPTQIANWLPSYIKRNNITKVIVVGSMDIDELIKLKSMGVEVKQVNGDSISSILTKIADNTKDKNNDTIIFTASDPMAGFLGACLKAPVFVTADNSTYASSQQLDENYIRYLDEHEIKNIIVVGSLPDKIIKKLNEYNATVEVITGQSSSQLSVNINKKLNGMGLIESNRTYYGFYGEIPAVIPSVIRDRAYLMEDSSFDTSTIDYLKENNVSEIYVTRNTESDYIQMEETDYISGDVIAKLEENEFNVTFLTKERTLDEATGLYDTKMILLESQDDNPINSSDKKVQHSQKTLPPLLEMLKKKKYVDSNNITADITSMDDNSWTVKWSTIHPYTWIKHDEAHYYATTNTGYEYRWIYTDEAWRVDYIFNNTTYYNTTWIENNDNTWTEMQQNKNYTWINDGANWYCYGQDEKLTYSLSILE